MHYLGLLALAVGGQAWGCTRHFSTCLLWVAPGLLEPSQPASCSMTTSIAGSRAAGMQHSWQTLRPRLTCEVDCSQGIDVVVHIGRVGATLTAIGPGKLGLGALKSDAQLIPAWHRIAPQGGGSLPQRQAMVLRLLCVGHPCSERTGRLFVCRAHRAELTATPQGSSWVLCRDSRVVVHRVGGRVEGLHVLLCEIVWLSIGPRQHPHLPHARSICRHRAPAWLCSLLTHQTATSTPHVQGLWPDVLLS